MCFGSLQCNQQFGFYQSGQGCGNIQITHKFYQTKIAKINKTKDFVYKYTKLMNYKASTWIKQFLSIYNFTNVIFDYRIIEVE